MLYQLMNRDVVVATYEEQRRLDDFHYELVEQLDPYLPYGFATIDDWVDGRQIAKHRASIERPRYIITSLLLFILTFLRPCFCCQQL